MLDWLHQKLAKKRPNLMGMHLWHSPQWTPKDYGSLTEEGYLKNVIVYRAVNLIAHNMASVPWALFDQNTPLTDHPRLTLIQQPNPKQSQAAFMESLAAYILLAGNAFIERIGEGDAQELYLLRPDRVKIIPGADIIPKAYEYEVNGYKRTIEVDPHSGHSRILHLKTFHPMNDWYGLSPIEAAASAIDQHNAVAGHNLSLLQNGGRPSGAVVIKPSAGGMTMTDAQRENLNTQLAERHQGDQNAGKLLILEGDMDWREMGLSPKDMDYLSGKHLSAREIAQTYGVPPMLVGVPGDATFSNYREARFHLWEDTILPLLNTITSAFNRWLLDPSISSLRFDYDIDAISALALRREPIWERLKDADFLTINEKRQALGYPPLPHGDALTKGEI